MTITITPARVVVLLTAVALVLILLLANAVSARLPQADRLVAGSVNHLVTAGDTLWEIAASHTLPGDDVRHLVFEIQRVNDLEGSVIVPGQVLQIPTSG